MNWMHPRLWLSGVLLVAAAVMGVAYGAGWRAYVMSSPSMGATAPVGSLAVSRPEGQVAVGQVIAFRPAGLGRTYVHRVVSVEGDLIRTRGDLNGSEDGWVLRPSQVEGRVVAVLPGVGYLARMAPLFVTLAALGWLVACAWGGEARSAARLLALALAASACLLIYRPLVGAEVVDSAPTSQGVQASVVATGILPVKVTAAHGTAAVAEPGRLVVLSSRARSPVVALVARPDLTGWWWALPVALCAWPLAAGAAMYRLRA